MRKSMCVYFLTLSRDFSFQPPLEAIHDVIYINIYHFESKSSIHMGYTCEVSEYNVFTIKFNL